MLKTLFLDIETSPNLAYTWEMYEQDVLKIVKQRDLLCFAWKWLGEKKVNVCGRCDCKNDKSFIKKLHGLFNEADIIIAQNGDEFDIKMCNTFFIKNGFNPPSPYKTIDTLKIARSKFRFNSNKLDDLGEYLGLGRKIKTGGFELWLKCLRNDKAGWKKMKQYNKRDVVLLEKVYNKLSSWAINICVNNDKGMICPNCGSDKINFRGWNFTRVFKNRRFVCKNCGRWSQSNLKVRYNEKEYLRLITNLTYGLSRI
jgi:DNA polymerase elongation subunit (family B)